MSKFLKVTVLLITLALPIISVAQSKPFIESIDDSNRWVDSIMRKLSRNERIAQLFMVRAHTDKGIAYSDSIARLIKKEKIGGLVFFQGGPGRQAGLTNHYQSISEVPLLIAMDAEWGVGMRLDSTVSFPYQMTLGAIQDNSLIYEMGREVAMDFKRLGMHVNFAPVADVNNNPKNPVIGFRSFGDDKFNVSNKVVAYMKGMQDNGIMVSLKHFPGHGDTDVDSHYDLPQLPFSRARLDSLELYPFREAIKAGASGVMIAHMNIPSLDNTPNMPSTLSKPIVSGLLKEDLGFRGLIFTDAMGMKGVVKFFPDGEADVLGLIAGNDILELSENSERGIRLVRRAIRRDRLSWARIDSSVRKMLAAKYWLGLNNLSEINTQNVAAELNRQSSADLNQRLADAAITLIGSDAHLPTISKSKRTAIVSIGGTAVTAFQSGLGSHFSNKMNFIISKNASAQEIQTVKRELAGFDQVIVGVHDTRKRPAASLDFNAGVKTFIADLAKMNTVMTMFANPYTIAALPGIESSKTLLMNYQNSEEAQRASVKVITGQMRAEGKLPVKISGGGGSGSVYHF